MILGIYGASGLGSEYYATAIEINKIDNNWNNIVFIDDTPEKQGQLFCDLPIMKFEDALVKFGLKGLEFIIAIGEPLSKDKIYKKLKENGCIVTSLLYPGTRVLQGAKLGNGLVVQPGNAIPPNSVFGNNVLIQASVIMGHDLKVEDNVVISSLDFIGGETSIGRNTYIAPHCCIRNGIHIGANCIIGMGSVVTKDVPDNAVMVGNPARLLRYNEKGRVFSK